MEIQTDLKSVEKIDPQKWEKLQFSTNISCQLPILYDCVAFRHLISFLGFQPPSERHEAGSGSLQDLQATSCGSEISF